MSALTVYGDPERSRSWWTVWMCRELGLEFENVPYSYLGADLKSDEFLAINPNGLIPAIKDGDFALWDSMAINLYLARKYSAGRLSPSSLEGEAQAWQWSFWAMTRLEFPMLTLIAAKFPAESKMGQYLLKHAPKPTPEEVERSEGVLAAPLNVLNGELLRKSYLLEEQFTVADLNVSGP